MLLAAATLLSRMGDKPSNPKVRAQLAVNEAQDLLDEVSRRALEAVRERALEVLCRTLYEELRQFEADDAVRGTLTQLMGTQVLNALANAGLLRQELP